MLPIYLISWRKLVECFGQGAVSVDFQRHGISPSRFLFYKNNLDLSELWQVLGVSQELFDHPLGMIYEFLVLFLLFHNKIFDWILIAFID